MNYLEEVQKSMNYLSKNKKVIFIGQSVEFPGSSIYVSLKKVPMHKRLELPVFEETQMGLSLGLSLNGFIQISCFPIFDFLILAMNQLVNHLDKIDYLTNNKFKSKIIVRTLIGSTKPLNAGPQHTQDHTIGIKKMLKFSKVINLKNKKNIFKTYKKIISSKSKEKIFVIIEDGNEYNK